MGFCRGAGCLPQHVGPLLVSLRAKTPHHPTHPPVSQYACIQEFIRVGYYVNNEYQEEELRDNPPDTPLIDRWAGPRWGARGRAALRPASHALCRCACRSALLVPTACPHPSTLPPTPIRPQAVSQHPGRQAARHQVQHWWVGCACACITLAVWHAWSGAAAAHLLRMLCMPARLCPLPAPAHPAHPGQPAHPTPPASTPPADWDSAREASGLQSGMEVDS